MTELIWQGKYDEKGNLKPVDRTILPFQVVETVNESKADRDKAQRDLFTKQARDSEWRNMLIWGDNKVVMSSLLPRFAGKINLIYIDPPFATGQDFSFRVRVGDEEFVKEPSIIEQKAYRDTWGLSRDERERGVSQLDKYLHWLYERVALMRELLADNGTIFVHADVHMGPYVKVLLDEMFGQENFLNQVAWYYYNKIHDVRKRIMPKAYDVIFWYAKDRQSDYAFNHLEEKRDAPVRQLKRAKVEGRMVNVKDEEGRVVYQVKETRALDNVWRIRCLQPANLREWVGFETQKPVDLIERVLQLASNPGDTVLDCFVGSGSTAIAAEGLGRRWIMCDLSKWAIQVTRKRLLQIEDCKPFEILNLGNYERHKLAANGLAGWERYVKFILDLYRAEPVSGFKMLHGKKARASVHIGSVDSPITMREIRETLKEAKEANIREVHFLGWDFEMGLHDLTKEIEEDYGVKPRLISIPKEALEVKDPAKEQIRFFDLNYLDLAHELKGKKLTVTIKDFIIANPEYLPDEVREKIRKFTDYIDYWAVDWDYRDDTFHNGYQSFRTRKNPKLETKASHAYDASGTHKVLVKVVDIFGNDTTKLIEVRIA